MRAVAEHYGVRVNRQGFCLCPFHMDSHPSMKIYQNGRGYYCFTCHNGGDVVKFAGQLFGISNEEACRKLIEDFSLPIKLDGLTYREKRERQKAQEKYDELRKFQKEARTVLKEYWKLLCDASHCFSSPHFYEAMQELSIVEYRLDCIERHPEEYYRDRKAVRRLGEIQRRVAQWDGGADTGGSISG